MAESIVVPGKFDIWIATPATSHATLVKLGQNIDSIEIPIEIIKAPVYGDKNGGRDGEPIEEQYLGERARVELELTIWDKVVAAELRTNGGITAAAGTILDSAVGALMRTDHCYRFYFIPVRDVSQAVNFPCALIERNQIIGGGSKHRALKLAVTFHRAPVGHVGGADNVFYNASNIGYPG